MTVRIEKPAINVREELADLRKPSGVAGEAMLRAETPQEQQALIGVGRRNILINGSLQVWQKGTSQVVSNNAYKNSGPDHMTTYYSGTYAQQFVTLPNGQYVSAMRYTAGSGTNASPNMNWIIEDGHKFMRNQWVTISWWQRGSKSGPNMATRVNNVGNSRYTSQQYVLMNSSGYIYPVTTEWTYHTRTMQIPSNPTYDHSLAEIWGTPGDWTSGDWFEVTQVQLELGKVATPFEHRSYGEELALCQRYFQDHTNEVVVRNLVPYTSDYAYTDSIIFPVTMRASPTITLSTAEYYNGVWRIPSSSVAYRNTIHGFNWEPVAAAGQPYTAWQPFLGIFRYTANAEL